MSWQDTPTVKLGEYVRSLREARGLSVRGLARELGLEPSYLSKIERDDSLQPSEKVLEAVATFLGANPHVLLAMAGKVTKGFQEALQRHPEAFAALIEKLQDAPERTVQRVAQQVRDGDW